MTPAELLALLRIELDDSAQDYLWSDATLYQYMDLAQREFAVRTELFRDSTTPEVCELAVSAELPELTLDQRIIRVESARLRSTGESLELSNDDDPLLWEPTTTTDYGRVSQATWLTETGTPRALVGNYDWTYARLAPIPTEDDYVDLTVVRFPLRTLCSTSTCFELKDVRHQYALADWVKHLAYSVNDADVVNPQLADRYAAVFGGKCLEFKYELVRNRRRPGNVRYGGL